MSGDQSDDFVMRVARIRVKHESLISRIGSIVFTGYGIERLMDMSWSFHPEGSLRGIGVLYRGLYNKIIC